MNLTPAQAHEAYVGPPSEPVEVSAFVETARDLPLPVFSQSAAGLPEDVKESWTSLSEDDQQKIRAECCVDELRTLVEDTVRSPRLMAHVTRTHEASVHAIYDTAEPSNKRKRKRITLADPAEEHPEVTTLRLKLEATKLKCWPLTLHAASFIRPPRQPDHNTLIHVKKLGTSAAQEHDALIFVTVYNRQSWGQRILSRLSQHVLLGSQPLTDLFRAIPCPCKELPEEIRDENGRVTGYQDGPGNDDMAVDHEAGVVMCIEGILYGESDREDDYAHKVLQLSEALPEAKRPALTKGSALHATQLQDLTVRLHEPYWMLHAGSCEHFFSVTAIRLRHPTDPPTGYPLTTQITPPLSDICRVCTKVPAVYSVVGDTRLGESPFLICGPCWRWMGGSKDDRVLVAPLPKHHHGWLYGMS
ncbi:snRNA-activating protein of 50kDa MW C terminal-domain-containing protein [Trametes elegans]|nr:snRNA-activating protein of 50kDa MW C terminal-domain-containing protein [Trametes elegans]